MRRFREYYFLALLLGSIAFFSVAYTVEAAVLFVSPASGTYVVGETFNIGVYTSSADQAMNAASGVLNFPADKLEIKSISKTGSIFNFWVQEPSFSNNSGIVNFEGIVLNPGYTGSKGKLVNITFKAKRSGNALLNFSSSSVLANDGLGTDILIRASSGSLSIISEPDVIETPPESSEDETPPEDTSADTTTVYDSAGTPRVTSSTHPDGDKWYNNANPEFSWDVPNGVISVQTLVGQHSDSVPIVTYDEPISEKSVEDMPDGTWYFHIRFNDGEDWGETAHFRFRVDTTKPNEFDVKEIKRGDLTIPQAKFTFSSDDDTSGIDHYEIKINEGEWRDWSEDSSGIYITPVSDPGIHTLTARAVDQAGNYLEISSEFEIKALKTPTINEYPTEIKRGETLTVTGEAYRSNSVVTVFIQRGKGEIRTYEVISEDDGLFTFTLGDETDNTAYTLQVTTNDLKSGVYTLWAVVTDDRGAKSNPSEKILFVVKGFSWLAIGVWLMGVLAVAVPVIALIMLILFIFWFGWYKFILYKKKLRKEILEAENNLHKAFALLREDVLTQIKLLEGTESKRTLTKEEKKVVKQLRYNLTEAEKFVGKEIRDIKRIVK